MTLTKEQIAEAIKEKYCPFCKDECRSFTGSVDAWQEFWFDMDEGGELVWDDLEGGDNLHDIECRNCGADIPAEIWRKWIEEEK